MSETSARRWSRAITVGALGLALYYAGLGGEYDHFDMLELSATRDSIQTRLVSLERSVDSATAWTRSLEQDAAVIERVARERHGYIRPGETLFWFVSPGAETETGAEPRTRP